MSVPRISALRNTAEHEGWDAFIVSQPQNRRYLSGFTGSAGFLLITGDAALLLTDFRYVQQANREAAGFEVVQLSNGVEKALPSLLREHAVQNVGFESAHVTVLQFNKWQTSCSDLNWIPTENVVENLRMIKEPEEIAAIRKAVSLADEAFEYVVEALPSATTELEVAWELESYMRTRGAEKVAFDLIVAAGPNGAMPHATTSTRTIGPAEPIVIDIGAVVDGYHSDMTRTMYLGRPDARFHEVYDVVLRAQEAAEKSIRPGMTAKDADEIAREVIRAAGYGPNFGHGLGHGVGLSVHESPRLGQTSTDVLRTGMTVTVEPGVYLPGWGGVRIEDLVVITEDGCEVLTRSNKRPLVQATN